MQHIERGRKALEAYYATLQDDHDFEVWVEILNLEEKPLTEVDILDGQVNFSRASEGPERTASLVLSDPEGALSFGTSFADDPRGVIYVNRLVRIRHQVDVPDYGRWTTTCMVGLPLAVSRSGGEIGLELADKSVLADHGVRPKTFKKGMNVRSALVSILSDLTGERHFRIPQTKKKLSRPYSVGMGEDALTPWQAFKRIAGKEMGWRAYYSSDGYATCESTRAKKIPVDVPWMLALPDSSTSFTDFVNYAKVTSKRKMKNKAKDKKDEKNEKKEKEITIIFSGVGALPRQHQLSEQSLNRNGVPRTLPLVVSDDNLKTQKAVRDRVRSNLKTGSDVDNEQAFEIMPLFHLDTADKIRLPMGVGAISFDECSIPLGTSGNMTVGEVRWVSKPVKVRRVRSKKTVIRKKKKGGKKNDE